MLLEDLHRQPGHLIRRAQQIAVAIFIEECAAFDLTPVQYAAMVAIQENEGIDATRLSAQIAFDRSTLGNVLERLEARIRHARAELAAVWPMATSTPLATARAINSGASGYSTARVTMRMRPPAAR